MKIFRSIKRLVSIGLLSIVFTLPANAQECTVCSLRTAIVTIGSDIVTAITNFQLYIESLVESSFGVQPGFNETVELNVNLDSIKEPITTTTNNLTWYSMTGAVDKSTQEDFNHTKVKEKLHELIFGDAWDKKLTESLNDKKNYQAQQSCGSHNLEFNSLLGPLTYRETDMVCAQGATRPQPQNQSEFALNYIHLVTDLINPTSAITPESAFRTDNPNPELVEKLMDDKSQTYKTYMFARRSWLASWSAVHDNLLYLYTQHLPMQSNGNLDNDADSPIELAHKIATRRSSSPEWYADMQESVGIPLQRETVFILAEIQRELNAMRMENQRLIALQAIQAIQALKLTKQMLEPLEMNVKKKAQALEAEAAEDGDDTSIPNVLTDDGNSDPLDQDAARDRARSRARQ